MNGLYVLTGATVHDDGACDELFGGDGSDWFFAQLIGTHRDTVRVD